MSDEERADDTWSEEWEEPPPAPAESSGPDEPAAERPASGKGADGDESPEPADPFAETFRARERPGGREARREQAAGSRYYYVRGHYFENVGNGQNGTAGIATEPVTARELNYARTGFAERDFCDPAREKLGRHGLVILGHGLSSAAKRRAALNLLGSGAEPVDEIDPRADLAGLHELGFRHGGRYLAMVETEAGTRTLGQFALNRLRDRLVEHECRLALVVANNLHLPPEPFGDYGVECGDPVEAWFAAETRPLGDYALLLAVAVLGGISHQAVVDAADRLHRSLARSTPGEEVVVEQRIRPDRDDRAKAVRARVRSITQATEFGVLQLNVLEFVDDDWYSAVLWHFWERKERMRRPLLRWLRELCLHEDPDVRTSAATAAGDLCRHDFGYVWPHVIVPWARSNNPMLRRAAALAAGIPAQDETLAPHVVGSLRDWARDETSPELRSAAADAFGSYGIGRRFPDIALRRLRKLLEKEPGRLAYQISQGVDIIFGAGRGEPEIAAKVLRALIDWSADVRKSPELARMSLGIFLNIAYGNVLPKDDEQAPGWPAVLFHADQDAEVRALVVTLCRGGLTDSVAQDPALEVLRHWTKLADEVSGVEAALERLLRDLSATHREWRQLCRHLRRWASKRAERPSRAAGRLLVRLMAAEPPLEP